MDDEVILPLTVENCIMLENLNYSLEEMAKVFFVSESYLYKFLSNKKIHHKTKYERLLNDDKSIRKIMYEYSIKKSSIHFKVSIKTIKKIKKRYKEMLDTKIINALSFVVKEQGYVFEIHKLVDLIENTTAEIIYKPENFPSDIIWGILVDLYGDYKEKRTNGWLNVFKYKKELLALLKSIID